MCRPILTLGAFAVLIVAVNSQVRIIHPIYRPPSRPQIIYRKVREAVDLMPLPGTTKPSPLIIYDDVKTDPGKRYVRSLSTPGTGRTSGSRHSSTNGGRSHDTGATHPGYNRRNTREAGNEVIQDIRWPFVINRHHPFTYTDIYTDTSKPNFSSTGPLEGEMDHRRYVRSLSTPGTGRTSGSRHSSINGGRSQDTGATHPGYNRRNAREAGNEAVLIRWPSTRDSHPPSTYADINMDLGVSHAGSTGPMTGSSYPGKYTRNTRSTQFTFPTIPPFNPRPTWPEPYRPQFPRPQRPFPIYV